MTLNSLKKQKWLALLLGSLFFTSSAFAAVTTPVVSSYPLVASSSPVTVLGSGTIGNTITLTGGLATSTATVDGSGNWNASVGLNPNALNTLTIFADDGMGSTSSSTMITILHDDTDPVFATTTNVTATATSTAGAVVAFPLPSATDNLSATTTVTCLPPSGGLFSLGTTTVTCTAVDDVGNTATTTFDVIVSSAATSTATTTSPITITSPTLTLGRFCTASSPLTITGTTDANADISATGGVGTATTTSDLSGAFSLLVALNPNALNQLVLQSVAGTSTSTTTFDVIFDTTAPVVTLNGDANMTVSEDSNFTDPGVTVSDNLDATTTVMTSGSVNTANPDTYTLTYTVTDCAGNTTTLTRNVTVENTGGGGGSRRDRDNDDDDATGSVMAGTVTDTNVPSVISVLPVTPQVMGVNGFFIPGVPNTGAGGMASANLSILLGAFATSGLGLYLVLRRKPDTVATRRS